MIRAFQWDLARQVERLDWLVEQLPRYASWGYQELYLHLEDAVEFPSFPGVARADAYSTADLRRLVEAATAAGIGVVPIVNLLGHTQYLIKDPDLRDLNELRNEDGSPQERGQLCPVHPRTLEVAERLIADMAPFATAGRLHVGLDESFLLGRHPLSRKEVAEIGLAAHFARYVCRLHALVARRGLGFGLWGDMLALLPEAIPLLPPGIAVYDWYYYPFATLPKMELHGFRPYDLATPLKARGIAYWGCAMNGAFRFEPLPLFGDRLANLASWWRRCQSTHADGFLSCSWEPNRLAMDLCVAVDAAAASLWLDPGIEDAPGLLAKGLERAFDLAPSRARAIARLCIACDERPFSGYTRWEINQRWDTTSTHDGIARFSRALGFFTRALSTPGLPAALGASLRLRRYLAARDVAVRQAAGSVYRLRRILAKHGAGHRALREALGAFRSAIGAFGNEITEGIDAARAMWALSRDPGVRGPNERLLGEDKARLGTLLSWIDEVSRDPETLMGPSPVCGRWQLQFAVILIEPALQKIVVEEEQAPGQWRTLHERFTIEFRSAAARRTSSIRLEWSVPLETLERPLRIAVRGVGRVALASIEATNGIHRVLPKDLSGRARHVLGTAAPEQGMPVLDWTRNEGALGLHFAGAARRPV